MNEQTMRYLEEHIPELAEVAFKTAYWQALAAGSNVLISENEHLVEVHPDGTKKILKQLLPPVHIAVGKKFVIQ